MDYKLNQCEKDKPLELKVEWTAPPNRPSDDQIVLNGMADGKMEKIEAQTAVKSANKGTVTFDTSKLDSGELLVLQFQLGISNSYALRHSFRFCENNKGEFDTKNKISLQKPVYDSKTNTIKAAWSNVKHSSSLRKIILYGQGYHDIVTIKADRSQNPSGVFEAQADVDKGEPLRVRLACGTTVTSDEFTISTNKKDINTYKTNNVFTLKNPKFVDTGKGTISISVDYTVPKYHETEIVELESCPDCYTGNIDTDKDGTLNWELDAKKIKDLGCPIEVGGKVQPSKPQEGKNCNLKLMSSPNQFSEPVHIITISPTGEIKFQRTQTVYEENS